MKEIEQAFKTRKEAGIAYTLDRMQALMTALGEPQEEIPVIHVAGTNGKGSTVTYMETLLRKAGKKTAAFMTPALGERHEQISSDGEPITEKIFAEALIQMMPAVEHVEKDRQEMISPFELLTAAAFNAAARIIKADVFLVEAGMGGRHDATNIVRTPRVTVITSIGTDHADYLGGTREAVAKEKAGIMRREVPCISACDQEADGWLEKEAAAIGALWEPLADDWNYQEPDILVVEGKKITLPARGEHQAINARTALAAARYITGVNAVDLQEAVLPGRWEALAENIFMDTAHNKEAVEALVISLPEDRNITFLTAVMRDKPVASMVRQWEARGTLNVCEMPDPRGMKKEEWYEQFPHVNFVDLPEKWLQEWEENSNAEDMLVVTGSHDFIRFIKQQRKK